MKWELDRTKYLTESEVEKLFSTCRQLESDEQSEFGHYYRRVHFMLRLLLDTGMRVSELANVRHRDLDLKSELPSVFVSRGKGKRKRYIPASKVLVHHAKDFIRWKENYGLDVSGEAYLLPSMKYPGRRMSISALENQFCKAVEASCIARKTIHAGRHSLGVRLYNSKKVGGNLKLIQQILGHSSTDVSAIYCHIPWDKLCGLVCEIAREKA